MPGVIQVSLTREHPGTGISRLNRSAQEATQCSTTTTSSTVRATRALCRGQHYTAAWVMRAAVAAERAMSCSMAWSGCARSDSPLRSRDDRAACGNVSCRWTKPHAERTEVTLDTRKTDDYQSVSFVSCAAAVGTNQVVHTFAAVRTMLSGAIEPRTYPITAKADYVALSDERISLTLSQFDLQGCSDIV